MSDLPSWARVGQKVVCIVSRWIITGDSVRPPDLRSPVFGDVLTIADIEPGDVVPGWLLSFDEMHPGQYFTIRAFRPLTNDDIEAALFRAKRPGQGEDAPLRDTVPA